MCTMTWWRDEQHYEVFFNRDELKTRAPATPPKLLESESGTRFCAPHDPVAGGTWMLANEHQVTVCLLNRWHETAPRTGNFQSRGLLVLAMADCRTAEEVMDRLQNIVHESYRPFTLVAIDPENIAAAAWNSENLSAEPISPPLTSSSYCFPEVSAARTEAFSHIPHLSPAALKTYHEGEKNASAYTVRMNRPDAQTWSRSKISVGPTSISWEYIAENPDLIGDGTTHQLKMPLK